MIKNYFKTAFTNMRRNKVYTLINVFGLSLGLVAVMLIVLYIRDEVSFDRFNVNGQNIYRIVQDGHKPPDGAEYKNGFTGGVQGTMFKQQIPEIKDICRINGGGSSLVKKGADILSEPILYADKSIFKIFSFPLLAGNPSSVLNGPDNIVISESVSKKYFGNANAVGKVLQINQDGKFIPFTVTGVAKTIPENSTIRFGILMSIERSLPKQYVGADWFSSYLNSFVCIGPNINPRVVEQKMAVVFDRSAGKEMAEYRKKYGDKLSITYKLQPYFKLHLGEYGTGNGLKSTNKVDYSYILGGIAGFILFIACINFINLSLSRSLQRSKEIGIRKVNGSSRGQLIIQFLSESFILTLMASLIALLLLVVSLPYFNELANKALQASSLLNGQVIILFILLIIINTLLSGFYPAIVLSGFSPVKTLYGKLNVSGKNYFGKSLVVVQFVVALFLVIGTIVMVKQFNFLTRSDLGYKPQGIVDVQIPHDYELFKNSLLKYPFIKQVSGQAVPFTSMYATSFNANERELNSTAYFEIDNDFLTQLKIPVLQGHGFTNIAGDTSEVLINESFIKAAGFTESPIGKKIKTGTQDLTIIGVVKDFHSSSLNYKIAPLVIRQPAKPNYGEALVKIDESQKVKALDAIRNEYKKIINDVPLQYNFLTDILTEQYESEQHWKQIITVSSIMSVLISCMGLFGLTTLAIGQRVKEIGIRKVLGAGVASISSTLMLNFLKLVFIAILIASPIAWYVMNIWLQNYVYRISMNLFIIGAAGSGALLLAGLTIGFQSVKAALANPVKSLRGE